MKMLVVSRKITVSILMVIVLICGLQGVSYAETCRVGDVLSPGESCTYVANGVDVVFSVKANGTACRAGGPVQRVIFGTTVNIGHVNFCTGNDIERDDTFNSNFSASKNADSSWTINTVPGAAPPPAQTPDLVVGQPTVSKASLTPGESFTLSTTVRNRGAGSAAATTLRYYRSTNATITTRDTEVGTDSVNALGASSTSNESIRLTAPTSAGTYYYGACVDSVGNEDVADNNCSATVVVTVQRAPVVSTLSHPFIYWVDVGFDKIQRANLDGSNVQTLVTGLYWPRHIALGISSPSTPSIAREDVNRDGVVDVQDMVYIAQRYGQTGQNRADVNNDGVVNIDDIVLVAAVVDSAPAAPAVRAQVPKDLTAATVNQWLTEAKLTGDKTPTYQRGILVLEQLLAALTPKETALLANYPNPFNPETWIPYRLANDTDVSLSIYDSNGVLVRELDLGHQRAGYYTDRTKAAYWDGRNAVGEQVASGIYFYQLRVSSSRSIGAGDYSQMRKMVVLK